MFILVAGVVSYFEILNIQATKSVTKIQYKLVTSDIRNSLAIYEKEYLDFYLKFQSIRNSLETIPARKSLHQEGNSTCPRKYTNSARSLFMGEAIS